MMRGNRRDAPRQGDQPDWETCIAWRRMLTAAVNASWDLRPVIEPLCISLREHLPVIADARRQDDIAFYLEEVADHLADEHPYGSCHNLLEALALFHEIVGPDRIEITGLILCRQFRLVYPNAPDGFERVGRMRQPPVDLLGLLGRVEPDGETSAGPEQDEDRGIGEAGAEVSDSL